MVVVDDAVVVVGATVVVVDSASFVSFDRGIMSGKKGLSPVRACPDLLLRKHIRAPMRRV